jgi:hypothetical protein
MKSVSYIAIGMSFSLLPGANRLRAQSESKQAYDPARSFTVEQLRSDFAVFRRILEEAHPGIHGYASKGLVNAALDGAQHSFDKPLTEREFARILARVISVIGDGHTAVHPSSTFARFLADRAKLLPVRFHFLRGRAYVVEDPTGSVMVGAEVRAINGQPMSALTDSLLQCLSGDGTIRTGKLQQLNDRFGYWYHRFIEPADQFELDCEAPSTHKRLHTRVAGLTVGERKAALSPAGAKKEQAAKKRLRLEEAPLPQTLILTIETFAARTEEFTSFLRDSFRRIQDEHVQDLIVDLRGNDGGDNFGPLLYSYLTDREFHYFASVETSTSSLASVRPYCRLGEDFVKTFQAQLVPTGNGRFRVKPEADPNLGTVKPQPNPYRNRVWLLTDGDTFSSTATFCSIVRSTKRGIFVGEETGGAHFGNCSGEMIVITLPETKVRVLIPLQQYTLAVVPSLQPSRGIVPDYPAEPEIEDVLQKTDVAMKKVFELIKDQRRR